MRPRFHNPWPHDAHRIVDILKWKLRLGPAEYAVIPDAPDLPAGRRAVLPEAIATPPASGWRVTWLGHASFLVQGGDASVLIDPQFSDYCSPFPLPGLRRMVEAPCSPSDLPPIDAILLTHGHYDHLDLDTLRRIGSQTPIVIADGHADWLRGKGFREARDLAWHEGLDLFPGVRLTSTPAQHFTARTPLDHNRGHWCGWLLEGFGCKLWHAGDSGYCPAFSEIGERHGPIDFGMIPIGAYMPRAIMKPIHLTPEEAVQAFIDTRCRRAVGMHWGTFRLTDEPMGEPPLRLARALQEKGLPNECFFASELGESWLVSPST